MKISEALALGSASSFVLTVLYFQGYSKTLGVNLFLYFSLNDYFRLAIEWLPSFLTFFLIGILADKAFTRIEGGRPRTAASIKHNVAQIVTIILTAVLATILSFLIPYPREQVYEVWSIAGPLLWLMLVAWYVKEPKLVQNWTKEWLRIVSWAPALAIVAFFLGLTAGQRAHSANQPADVLILLKGATEPATGKVLFVLDDYILLREEAAGIVALPKTEVKKIVHQSESGKPALTPSSTVAQEKSYPERPITLLVPYGPGSASDQSARALAEAMKKHLPQPIVVVNRNEVTGTRAIAEALTATPDGYTLVLGTDATLTVQPQRMTLPYAGPDTYAPVAKLAAGHPVLIVKADARWKTAQEFLDDARAHPGQLSVGVPGLGTVADLDIEQLQRIAKITFKVVSLDAPQQVAAAISRRIDAAGAFPAAVAAAINEHKAIMLGVFSDRRLALAPNVPTFKELGFDITLGSFGAIVAPRGTPKYIVTTLSEAIKEAMAEPPYMSHVKRNGGTIDYEGPEALTSELQRQYQESGELVRSLGLAQK